MKSCEICNTLPLNNNTILDLKYWRVTLDDEDQYYLGRSFVTAKRHVANLSQLSKDEWIELIAVISRFEAAARSAFGATLFNWSCLTNNAFQEKPYNPHIHWHVRPRYDHIVKINDEEFNDTEFGHHYAGKTSRIVSQATIDKILTALQDKII